jgi:RNA polymerase sigma-70 factor (ECF subfamily)
MVDTDKTNSGSDRLERLKRRDPDAFRQLVTEYHDTMLVVSRGITGDSLAEEVVQEAWLSVYNAIPKFESRSSLKTWIYTIVSNQALTRLRKESRTTSLDQSGAESSYLSEQRFDHTGHWATAPHTWHLDSPDQLLEEQQLQECIEKTLGILSEKQKAVFVLRDMEQQSLEDICNILHLSQSNVRVMLHRARLQLLEMIDHYQETATC